VFLILLLLIAALTPEQRVMRARIAAFHLHAHVQDPSAHTAPARQKFLERFEREVDPDGVLPLEDRKRRAQRALKEHMIGLALKSSQARRKHGTAS
jgi:hypothetical protein